MTQFYLPTPSPASFERRRRTRLPLRREVEFSVIGSGTVYAGTTVNISDKAFAFQSTADLPVGAELEVSISWPAERGAPLVMAARGRVVRREGQIAACTIEQSTFRPGQSRVQ
jgi:hypothetical protein